MPKKPKNFPKKGTPPSPDDGPPKKEPKLELVKQAFETEKEVGAMRWQLKVRRRMQRDGNIMFIGIMTPIHLLFLSSSCPL